MTSTIIISVPALNRDGFKGDGVIARILSAATEQAAEQAKAVGHGFAVTLSATANDDAFTVVGGDSEKDALEAIKGFALENGNFVRFLVNERDGNFWKGGDKARVYINGLDELAGVEVSRYGTGNISHATYKGQKISNGQARRMLNSEIPAKLYLDCVDGCWHWIGGREAVVDDIIAALQDGYEPLKQAA